MLLCFNHYSRPAFLATGSYPAAGLTMLIPPAVVLARIDLDS